MVVIVDENIDRHEDEEFERYGTVDKDTFIMGMSFVHPESEVTIHVDFDKSKSLLDDGADGIDVTVVDVSCRSVSHSTWPNLEQAVMYALGNMGISAEISEVSLPVLYRPEDHDR